MTVVNSGGRKKKLFNWDENFLQRVNEYSSKNDTPKRKRQLENWEENPGKIFSREMDKATGEAKVYLIISI